MYVCIYIFSGNRGGLVKTNFVFVFIIILYTYFSILSFNSKIRAVNFNNKKMNLQWLQGKLQ